MKTYQSHLQENFAYLKNGQKTIEGRLQKGWYQNLKEGDHIHFYNEDETDEVVTKVLAVRKYRDFLEMLTNEPINKVLPNVSSISKGVSAYRQFYSDAQVARYGVIAIEVEVFTS